MNDNLTTEIKVQDEEDFTDHMDMCEAGTNQTYKDSKLYVD
jgi:hypothetical protein